MSACEGKMRRRITWGQKVSEEKKVAARQMRKAATDAEGKFWRETRGRRLCGLKFRRQQVIRGFIVDFYCAEECLAIELDGGIHERQRQADEQRQKMLEELGVEVLRFSNEEVLREWDGVRRRIEEVVSERRRARESKNRKRIEGR